jgi:hypothetical protein
MRLALVLPEDEADAEDAVDANDTAGTGGGAARTPSGSESSIVMDIAAPPLLESDDPLARDVTVYATWDAGLRGSRLAMVEEAAERVAGVEVRPPELEKKIAPPGVEVAEE